MQWTNGSVKTLGIYHGSEVKIEENNKNQKLCTCVENKEPLFPGKSFVNSIIWNFLWNGKTNQIERNIVMLNKKRGGLNMIHT